MTLPEGRKPITGEELSRLVGRMQGMALVNDRVRELEDKLEKAVAEMEKVDEYLTRLQTPNSEPLNSVNSCSNKKGRGQYTAMVRNEAREYWASLGNTIKELKGQDND